MPLLVGWASTSSSLASGASSANSRLRPPPATTGLIIKVSSSSTEALPPHEKLSRIADAAVDVFLAAYG